MTGKKGRSGRITTAEQAQARARSGAKGAASRWAKEDAARAAAGTAPEVPPLTAEQEAAVARVAPHLPAPVSWREALQRVQTAVGELKREILAIELEEARAERIRVDVVRESLEALRASILREMATLPGIADTIPEGRPHQVEAVRGSLLAWIEGLRRALQAVKVGR